MTKWIFVRKDAVLYGTMNSVGRWMTVLDSKGDGVIHGAQPNTYDCAIYGANTFIGTYYMAALLAAEQMALLQVAARRVSFRL